jgi:UDP-N-acetylmuramyl tripeptide synthase
VRCGLGVATLSRRAGLGGGSIIGGRVTLALHPGALGALSAGRGVVLVSGTNGKTTTSHMLAAALRTGEPVAHNSSGSNMADGAVAALAGDQDARLAVLEVDELHLASVAARCSPKVVVLLNLSRDQLDRCAEVRSTAAAISAAVVALPDTTIFANADDPMSVWAVEGTAKPVVWVAAGSSWRDDCPSCPRCGVLLACSKRRWSCGCGLTQPEPAWWCEGSTAHGPGVETELRVRLPGRVNQYNALVALAVAATTGSDLDRAREAVVGVDQVAGRYSTVRYNGRDARLLLAKNPAGWAAALGMIERPRPLLIVINAREADGRDTSWLWDVDFGCLAGRTVVASGERAADLGTRLTYVDVPHRTEPDPLVALKRLPAGEVDVIANYSAFHSVLRDLGGSRSSE